MTGGAADPTSLHSRRPWPAVLLALRDACLRRDTVAISATLGRRSTLAVDHGRWAASPRPYTATGAEDVAAALAGLLPVGPDLGLEPAWATGMPALVLRTQQHAVGVLVVDARRRHIRRLWLVLDPDKLSTWNQGASPNATRAP